VLYPLAFKVGKDKWAGVITVLVAGILTPMPNFFTNWGRYTQLAGLCILPIAIYLAWTVLEHKKYVWHVIWIGWILFAGLALTHYRVLMFAMAFFPVIFLLSVRRIPIKGMILKIALLATGAIVIFLPWFVHILPSSTIQSFANSLRTPAGSITAFTQQYNAINNLTNYMPIYLWILLLISIVYSLWLRKHEGLTMILWWSLIVLLANPEWLSLPGTGAISNFAVFISIYAVSAILIGSSFGWAIQSPQKSWLQPILIGFLLIAIPYGIIQRNKDIDPIPFSLATRPDLHAAKWIQENTSSSSQFLVNGFFAYGGTIVVGSDGGWWLPLTAQRGNTVPPINYASEEGTRSNYSVGVNELYETLQARGISDSEFLRMLKLQGVTHAYIGQREGRVNYSGPSVLEAEAMILDGNFDLLYHVDNVWIFQIR
jgi:hypothetical protein